MQDLTRLNKIEPAQSLVQSCIVHYLILLRLEACSGVLPNTSPKVEVCSFRAHYPHSKWGWAQIFRPFYIYFFFTFMFFSINHVQ